MTRSTRKSFTAILEPLRGGLGWVIARVPFDVKKTWPSIKGRKVRGEIEGFPFRTSLFPWSGEPGHFLLVNKKMQRAARAGIGSQVSIQLEPDLEEREAKIPPELEKILRGDRALRTWYGKLSYSYRKAFGDGINAPKSPAARVKRAEQLAEQMLLAMEGEHELPPILNAAFQREPLARKGWQKMTPVQRRSHLLGIFYYKSIDARERRAGKAIEEALKAARKQN
jgi:uncharacterized protein YdeI (YjbR/CyaY-like superfamily)